MSTQNRWKIYNPSSDLRILVTKMLPGQIWIDLLINAGLRVEVNTSEELTPKRILLKKIGNNCMGVIGQLTETWDAELFKALKKAGGKVYCNYAVGVDNVDLNAATEYQIAVGNTPGILTETTAEMALALTLACARRIVESDQYLRADQFKGWLPGLFLGERLKGKTLGIIGTGRIGLKYAKMMSYGFKVNLIYYSRRKNEELENSIVRFNYLLKENNENPISIKKSDSLKELLIKADIVSLHVPLNNETNHLIQTEHLSIMKDTAILINTSRGAVIHEAALAEHCAKNKNFKAGLDVFENEPVVNDKLKKLKNVTLTPHIASATRWTREAMAKIAALNISGIINEFPFWDKEDVEPFLEKGSPRAVPSIINKQVLDRFYD